MSNSIEFVCTEGPSQSTRGVTKTWNFISKKIEVEELRKKLKDIFKNVNAAIPDIVGADSEYRIDTLEFSIVVDVKGQVRVLGSGLQSGLAGGIKVVLKCVK